jgi:hypothetical protein
VGAEIRPELARNSYIRSSIPLLMPYDAPLFASDTRSHRGARPTADEPGLIELQFEQDVGVWTESGGKTQRRWHTIKPVTTCLLG